MHENLIGIRELHRHRVGALREKLNSSLETVDSSKLDRQAFATFRQLLASLQRELDAEQEILRDHGNFGQNKPSLVDLMKRIDGLLDEAEAAVARLLVESNR